MTMNLIVIFLYLVASAAGDYGEKCVTGKGGYRICVSLNSGEWRGYYTEFGEEGRVNDGNVILQGEPTGTVIPVNQDGCGWPAALAEGVRMKTFTGEWQDDWIATVRHKVGSFYGRQMSRNERVDYVYDCFKVYGTASECQDIPTSITNMTIMVDIEKASGLTNDWIDRNDWVKRTNRVLCYISTPTAVYLTAMRRFCSVLIGNGYDSGATCHLQNNFPSGYVDGQGWLEFWIGMGMYGYKAGVQCAGPYEGEPMFDNITVGGSCMTTGNRGSLIYPQLQTTCVAPSPTQMFGFYKSDLLKEQVTKSLWWFPGVADAGLYKRRLDLTRKTWDSIGNELLGNSAGSRCSEKTGKSITACTWIVWIKGDMSGCTGEVQKAGYVGKRVCLLECTSQVSYKECDGLVCRKPVESEYPRSAKCKRVGGGVLVDVRAEYAKAGNRKCTGALGGLFCEGPDDVTSLCGQKGCSEFNCMWENFRGGCKEGLCEEMGKVVPHTDKGRQKRSVGEGQISAAREGGSMAIVATSSQGVSGCKMTGGGRVYTWSCEGTTCVHSMALTEIPRGVAVIVECGDLKDGFMWEYSGPAGISTGHEGADYVLDTYAGLKWWQQVMIGIIVLSALQMLYVICRGREVMTGLWRLMKWVMKLVVNLRGAGRELKANIGWFWVKEKMCAGCGSDMNFVEHKGGKCPFYQPGDERAERGICPLGCDMGMCCQKVEKGEDGVRHWTLEHMHFYNQPLVMWINPLNWLKFARIPRERMPAQGVKKQGGKKLSAVYTLGVVLALVSRAESLTNIVGTGVCVDKICTGVTTNVVQEGLWMSDHSCYSVAVGEGSFRFCVSGSLMKAKTEMTVTKCRAKFDIKSWSKIDCASGNGACNDYRGEMDKYKDCGLVMDEDMRWSGWTDWGCTLPNVNSLCNKAALVSAGGWTYCMANAKTTSFDAGICITMEGKTACAENKTVEMDGLRFEWTEEASLTEKLEGSFMVSNNGEVKRVVSENGCFGLYTENFGTGGCGNPVKGWFGKCQRRVEHWWDVRNSCAQESEESCKDMYSYAHLEGGCSVVGVKEYRDGTGFSVESSGCTQGSYKLLMKISGNVTLTGEQGKVESVTATGCEGYSGAASGYSCKVMVRCSGNVASCQLTSPTQAEMACGVEKRVFYSGQENNTACFRCGGEEECITNTGKKYAPRPDDPNYNKGVEVPSLKLTWWMIMLIALASVAVFFGITVLVVILVIRSERKRD